MEIHKGKYLMPPRIVAYGSHGIGKSTFGSTFPHPIFVQTEDGLGNLDVHSFSLAKVWPTVLENLKSLKTEAHDYQTVVVDSLDWLEKLIWEFVCKTNSASDILHIPYGRGYLQATNCWNEFLASLNELRQEKKMITLLLAHSQIKRYDAPETESYDRYQLDLHKQAASLLSEWSDIILFVNYKLYTAEKDVGFGGKIVKAIGSGERIMFAEERPAFIAKNRYGLLPEMPFSWEILAKMLFKNNNQKEK